MKVKFENSIARLPHFKAGIMQQTMSFEVMKRNCIVISEKKMAHKILWNFADFDMVKSRNFVVVGSLGLEPRTIRL